MFFKMNRNLFIALCLVIGNYSFCQSVTNIVTPIEVTVLPAYAAILSNELKPSRFQDLDKDPKVFAIEGWENKDQRISWNIKVTEKGKYKIAILLQVKRLSGNGIITIHLASPDGKVILKTKNTGWDKLFFSESLMLDKGNAVIELQLIDIPAGEKPEISMYSIEAGTDDTWSRNDAMAASLRSKPAWLTGAKYALFFHWNARSKPERGTAKTYQEAVRDFDVSKFAAMVKETGADFIVLTTSWSLQTFPAPLKSLDEIMPGNTTSRDLIADMADALSRWRIKLVVYCNFRINRMGWKYEDRLVEGKTESYFNKMLSIYSEISTRYANKIGGLWIDDGMGLYPHGAPFEKFAKAIKSNDKDMVVGYNSWIYPKFTDFQDFYGGEHGITLQAAGVNDKHLPAYGDGYFISGPQKNLKATFCGLMEPGDWTHTESNQTIPAPLLKPNELINIIREAIKRKNVAIMNVRIYQDGSISPTTFDLLQQLNKAVH